MTENLITHEEAIAALKVTAQMDESATSADAAIDLVIEKLRKDPRFADISSRELWIYFSDVRDRVEEKLAALSEKLADEMVRDFEDLLAWYETEAAMGENP